MCCGNDFCDATLGFSDHHNDGIRLLKWTLRVDIGAKSPLFGLPDAHLEPSIAWVISAQILALMNASCVSRLLITPRPGAHPTTPVYPSLSIWVFNPSIRYTSSYFFRCRKSQTSTFGKPGILAMKVLWEAMHVNPELFLAQNESVENLELPGTLLCQFQKHLEDTAKYLPPSARKLQEWSVGLLERYEAEA